MSTTGAGSHRRGPRGMSAWGRRGVVAGVVMTLLAAGVTVARAAGTVFFEDLERGAGARVIFDGNGDFSAGITTAYGGRSPRHAASLTINTLGFVSVGRRSSLAYYPGMECEFGAWVRLPDGESEATGVNMEVIDASTFRYVAIARYGSYLNDEWFRLKVRWTNGRSTPKDDLLFRVSLRGHSHWSEEMAVDDLEVFCKRGK